LSTAVSGLTTLSSSAPIARSAAECPHVLQTGSWQQYVRSMLSNLPCPCASTQSAHIAIPRTIKQTIIKPYCFCNTQCEKSDKKGNLQRCLGWQLLKRLEDDADEFNALQVPHTTALAAEHCCTTLGCQHTIGCSRPPPAIQASNQC